MKEKTIQFLIKIDEGVPNQDYLLTVRNMVTEDTWFKAISGEMEVLPVIGVTSFVIDVNETDVNEKYYEFITEVYPDYDFFEPNFSVYMSVNGYVSSESLDDDILDFLGDDGDYVEIETIQRWIDNKGYLEQLENQE